MRTRNLFTIAGISLLAGLAGACTSDSTPANSAGSNRNAATTANAAPANANAHKTDDETPAAVKAALPDAQSFTVQHKDVPKDAMAEIERDAGAKVPATDHHSYLAFSTTGGKRTQVGAATVVKAGGKDVVIIYDSKDGSPTIREVRVEGVSPEFLKQFAGKDHDDIFSVGNDIKLSGGVDDATAKAIAQAVRIDSMTMQALYGAAHSH
jgi:hypothetical protein